MLLLSAGWKERDIARAIGGGGNVVPFEGFGRERGPAAIAAHDLTAVAERDQRNEEQGEVAGNLAPGAGSVGAALRAVERAGSQVAFDVLQPGDEDPHASPLPTGRQVPPGALREPRKVRGTPEMEQVAAAPTIGRSEPGHRGLRKRPSPRRPRALPSDSTRSHEDPHDPGPRKHVVQVPVTAGARRRVAVQAGRQPSRPQRASDVPVGTGVELQSAQPSDLDRRRPRKPEQEQVRTGNVRDHGADRYGP